jgi:hypothetical protein
MASPTYNPLPRIAFLLLRLWLFLFSVFYSLTLSGWIIPYPSNILSSEVPMGESPPGFPSLEHDEPWKRAAKDISGISIIIIFVDVFFELRYGGLHFIFLRTRLDRPYVLDGFCAVIDLLFALTFALTAGYSARPFNGFTFPGKSCQHDAAIMSKTSNQTNPGYVASVYLCLQYSQIVVMSIIYRQVEVVCNALELALTCSA